MGYIETVEARELSLGDTFSTDSGIVIALRDVPANTDAESCVDVTCACHGILKSATLAYNFPCPLWREL